jgi:hypothetical protein
LQNALRPFTKRNHDKSQKSVGRQQKC